MRDLIVTQNITLDGVIDASEGWFAVADDPEVDRSDLQEALAEQSAAADAVLFGRVTFEEMRGYWPEQTDDTTGVTDYLNRVAKYVLSGTLGDPGWEPTTVLPADGFADAIGALKAGPRHRHHRQHHPGPRPDRGRTGRRVPAVRVPGRPRPGRRLFPDGTSVPA